MADKEYIDRHALLGDLDAAMKNSGMGYVIGQTMKRYIKRVPAADVVEVRHGEWEIVQGVFTPGGDPLKRCPYCKSPDSEHLDGIESRCQWNWCPVCGTKMDGGKHG